MAIKSSPNSKSMSLGKDDQDLKPYLDKVDNVSEYLKFLIRRDLASNDNKSCTDYRKFKYNFNTPVANNDSNISYSNIDELPDYLKIIVTDLAQKIVSEDERSSNKTSHFDIEDMIDKKEYSSHSNVSPQIAKMAIGQGSMDKI